MNRSAQIPDPSSDTTVTAGERRLENTSGGGFRIPAEGDVRVPVELYLSQEWLPQSADLAKLARIAATPGLSGHLDVLPDLHFKAKNFVPTGVAIRLANAVCPMFVGPPNDSMMIARTGIDESALGGDALDQIFAKVMQRIAMFRRTSPVIDEHKLWPILRFGGAAIYDEWGFTGEDLAQMDNGAQAFPASAPPAIADIRGAFPGQAHRPGRLPNFVPWHDLVAAGRHCLGVLDGGGHFLELSAVNEIMNPVHAAAYGLKPGEVCVALHAGSADVGLIAHKHYLRAHDSEINVLPADSEQGSAFRLAMGVATNFAYANRLYIMAQMRETLHEVIGERGVAREGFRIFSDAPHDMMDEFHGPDGTLFVHRKGVVRGIPGAAYANDHPYAKSGRPFFFPTALGESAYIMTRAEGDPDAFLCCSHGVGRSMSREQALAAFDDDSVVQQIRVRNVRLYRYGHPAFSAQAPAAHKDTAIVMDQLERFGLASPVARLKPLASLKA